MHRLSLWWLPEMGTCAAAMKCVHTRGGSSGLRLTSTSCMMQYCSNFWQQNTAHHVLIGSKCHASLSTCIHYILGSHNQPRWCAHASVCDRWRHASTTECSPPAVVMEFMGFNSVCVYDVYVLTCVPGYAVSIVRADNISAPITWALQCASSSTKCITRNTQALLCMLMCL